MAVTVRELEPQDSALEEIYEISQSELGLTPRKLQTLKLLARDGHVIAAFKGDELVAWALREPLTKNCYELGMFFVKPKHRGLEVFLQICPALVTREGSYIFATYNQKLLDYAIKDWGFREATIAQVTLKSRGKFITKRLDKETRASVSRKMKQAKPLLAIRDAR